MNRAEGVTVSKLMRGETAGNTTTHTASPQQRAEEQVKDALSKYNETIELATKQMEAGNITEAEYKKQLEQGQQRLYDAYGQAYRTYADPKYKEAQQQAADEIVRLGGEVKVATEAQKKTQESARQLEQAQKELAKYEKEAADAMSRNDLTGYFAAMEKVKTSKNKVTQLTSPTDSHEEELAKARKVQSTPIAPKEFTITANFEEALAKIRKIESAKITPKEFIVTAETEDAMAKLREVLGKQVPDKEFIISATDKSLPLMQAIEGVSIQPKTFVVTAETEEAMGKLREVVNAEIGNKEFIISANDEEALAKARKIDSVKITPKTFVVTAETAEAMSQLREVMGEQVPDKTFIISATKKACHLCKPS
jgi:hypothetical protein